MLATIIFASLMSAQSSPPSAPIQAPAWPSVPLPAPNTTTPANPPAFPEQGFVVMPIYQNHASPHFSVAMAGVKCIHDSKSACLGSYSFTGFYVLDVKGKIVNVTTTGLAQHMRELFGWSLYAVGTAGLAYSAANAGSSTSSLLSAAFNGGLLAHKNFGSRGFGVDILGQATSAAGSTSVTVGLGVSWMGK